MNHARSRRLLAATLVAASLALAAPAAAQRVDINTPHSGSRPLQLDLHAGFSWWGFGATAGARLGIPLVSSGPIDSINNALYLNFGVDMHFVRCRGCRGGDAYHPGVGVPVTVHWEFYFSETWSVFAEAGINVYFHPGFLRNDHGFFDHDGVGGWFIGAVGARLHINEWFGLVLRLGTPYSSFGITFYFG